MLTNAHVWAGYTDPGAHVPWAPCTSKPSNPDDFSRRGTEVLDAQGLWMATFRNWEDAARYKAWAKELDKKVKVARKEAHENSAISTGDDDRCFCRVCWKYFGTSGIGQHTRAKHGIGLMKMLDLPVPTERHYREFRQGRRKVGDLS
jgi:hypothetical protein